MSPDRRPIPTPTAPSAIPARPSGILPAWPPFAARGALHGALIDEAFARAARRTSRRLRGQDQRQARRAVPTGPCTRPGGPQRGGAVRVDVHLGHDAAQAGAGPSGRHPGDPGPDGRPGGDRRDRAGPDRPGRGDHPQPRQRPGRRRGRGHHPGHGRRHRHRDLGARHHDERHRRAGGPDGPAQLPTRAGPRAGHRGPRADPDPDPDPDAHVDRRGEPRPRRPPRLRRPPPTPTPSADQPATTGPHSAGRPGHHA